MVVRPLRCLPWILPDTGCLGPSAQFPGQVTLLHILMKTLTIQQCYNVRPIKVTYVYGAIAWLGLFLVVLEGHKPR